MTKIEKGYTFSLYFYPLCVPFFSQPIIFEILCCSILRFVVPKTIPVWIASDLLPNQSTIKSSNVLAGLCLLQIALLCYHVSSLICVHIKGGVIFDLIICQRVEVLARHLVEKQVLLHIKVRSYPKKTTHAHKSAKKLLLHLLWLVAQSERNNHRSWYCGDKA